MKQLFKDAYDLINKVHWVQGRYRLCDENGVVTAYCLVGAINDAAKNPTERDQAVRVLTDVLGCSPISWNDDLGRTKREVLKLLLKVQE